jgi:hypothetical protein
LPEGGFHVIYKIWVKTLAVVVGIVAVVVVIFLDVLRTGFSVLLR